MYFSTPNAWTIWKQNNRSLGSIVALFALLLSNAPLSGVCVLWVNFLDEPRQKVDSGATKVENQKSIVDLGMDPLPET